MVEVTRSLLRDALQLPSQLIRRRACDLPACAQALIVRWLSHRVDPFTTEAGEYLAKYGSRIITVRGPGRVYPSGLKYYVSDDIEPGYVFAGQLDWVATPLATKAAEATQHLATQSKQVLSTFRRMQPAAVANYVAA